MNKALGIKLALGSLALLAFTKKAKGGTKRDDLIWYDQQVRAWLAIPENFALLSQFHTKDEIVKAIISYLDALPVIHERQSSEAWTLTEVDKYNTVAGIVGANKALTLQYTFTASHITVQRRIDHYLGDALSVCDYHADNGWRIITLPEVGNLIHANADWWSGHRHGKWSQPMLMPWGEILHIDETKMLQKGYLGVDWMAYSSAEEAMKGVFAIATSTDSGPAIDPGDTFKAYSYPTPLVEKVYGSNLPFFIRCHPQNIGCQLFGVDIAASQALMIVGSLVATIATVGAASELTIPIMLAALSEIAPTVTTIAKIAGNGTDADKAAQAVSELSNIANGASIDVTGGTIDDMRAEATDFINNNQDIFTLPE